MALPDQHRVAPPRTKGRHPRQIPRILRPVRHRHRQPEGHYSNNSGKPGIIDLIRTWWNGAKPTAKGPRRTPRTPRVDALRQQQRAYERRIRELKWQDAIAKECGSAEASRIRCLARDNDRKNLSYRTSLTVR